MSSIKISPDSGLIKPTNNFAKVDFPEPLFPEITEISDELKFPEKFLTIYLLLWSYEKFRFLTFIFPKILLSCIPSTRFFESLKKYWQSSRYTLSFWTIENELWAEAIVPRALDANILKPIKLPIDKSPFTNVQNHGWKNKTGSVKELGEHSANLHFATPQELTDNNITYNNKKKKTFYSYRYNNRHLKT